MSVGRTVLDHLGARVANYCCAIPQTNKLVGASLQALFFSGREGREPCLAFVADGNRPLLIDVAHYTIPSTGNRRIRSGNSRVLLDRWYEVHFLRQNLV